MKPDRYGWVVIVAIAVAVGIFVWATNGPSTVQGTPKPTPTITPTMDQSSGDPNGFLAAVHKKVTKLNDQVDLALGYGFCTELEDGASVGSVADSALATGLSAPQATTLFAASVRYLCPSEIAEFNASQT